MQKKTKRGNLKNRKPEDKIYDELLTFILSGELRSKIYVTLASKPNYAYRIAKMGGLCPASVFRSLKALEEMKIIECLNPMSHRRRFYRLSQKGEKIKDSVFECIVNQPLGYQMP